MSYQEHVQASPRHVRVALLTVSDSRTRATDASGRVLERLLRTAGHHVTERRIVADGQAPIRNAARKLLANADALVVTGGTGASPRDVTPEALAPLFVKEFPGFGELFRALSQKRVGSGAYLSRATLGLVRSTRTLKPVWLLPGSPQACRLALRRLIAPELGHVIALAARRPTRHG